MNYIADFQARSDLTAQYGNNALLLYALQLRFEISDIISVASDALTDGGNDKKCDLIYVDQDTGVAVVAQGYMKQTPKEANLAPGNKASDLNTAATWVFAQNPDEVPEQIREQVRLLQSSIENNFVSTIYFWYVHNLNEQNNPQIKEELTAMQTSARALLKTLFPKNEVEIFAVEVGNETIEKWYNAASKQIAVTDTLDVETPKVGFELTGDKWRAYVTAVSAKWLQQKYATYKDDIFSGNPRTYLGSGKKKNKINLGIMETIDQQPGNFWAYNNGITALVNDYVAPHEGKDDLTISGITIINGAQTTGAISSVETLKDAWIPIRFIVCNDANIIDDIINNNNKQNEILPSDLRSNDKTQNRLRAEFAPYTKLYYSGGRRGNVRPSRSKEILDPYVVAQALLTFHGDCVTAYNSKKMLRPEVVTVDRLYGGGDAHEHGVGNLIDLHHHSVDREGDVAAVHAGRSVNPQQVVQGDLYQGSEDLGQQAGNPQGQNPPGEPNGGAQRLAPEPDCVQPGQVGQKQHPGRHLADDCGNAGPHHAHAQREDEDGV